MNTAPAEDVPIVCRRLRSKGAGVVYGDRVTFEAGYAITAIFWCLTTADAIGPDDGFVHPHVCVNRRVCFCDQPAPADVDEIAHPASHVIESGDDG